MHDRQISPMGRPDGGTNLLGAILTRLGIVAIVVVGVLIAPAGLPDLSSIASTAGPTASATTMEAPSSAPADWSAPRRALEAPPSPKVTPAVWIPEKATPSIPRIETKNISSTIEPDGDRSDPSASRSTDERRPRTMFQRVCRGLRDGLERLGGFVIARGFRDPSGHRIPASFMPSRS